jgi:ATP-dependent Clp protease ATP-binding subunit ClpB
MINFEKRDKIDVISFTIHKINALVTDEIGEAISKIFNNSNSRVIIDLKGIESLLGTFNLKIVLDDDVIDWLAEKGYDPQLGARPVKRLIQKEIINELSKEIIGGKVSKEDTIMVKVNKDHLSFTRVAEAK